MEFSLMEFLDFEFCAYSMCLWIGRIPGNLHSYRCRALLASPLHTASPPHSIVDHAANPASPFSSATTRWAQNQLPERPSRSFTSVRSHQSLSGLIGLYLAPSRSLFFVSRFLPHLSVFAGRWPFSLLVAVSACPWGLLAQRLPRSVERRERGQSFYTPLHFATEATLTHEPQ